MKRKVPQKCSEPFYSKAFIINTVAIDLNIFVCALHAPRGL